jgi:hypothetical protein
MRNREIFTADLEPVRRQLDEWRTTRNLRGRLPETLWQAATELARAHGVNAVARALHLDYYGLKRRVQGGAPQRGGRTGAPAFVEVQLEPARGWECQAQLEDRRGAKMNLRLVGGGTAEVATLVQSFWRRRP